MPTCSGDVVWQGRDRLPRAGNCRDYSARYEWVSRRAGERKGTDLRNGYAPSRTAASPELGFHRTRYRSGATNSGAAGGKPQAHLPRVGIMRTMCTPLPSCRNARQGLRYFLNLGVRYLRVNGQRQNFLGSILGLWKGSLAISEISICRL